MATDGWPPRLEQPVHRVTSQRRQRSRRLSCNARKGRKALARFHSDKMATMGGAALRRYRKVFDHRIRTFNDRMLRCCLADPEFDPVFQPWHKHAANRSWW